MKGPRPQCLQSQGPNYLLKEREGTFTVIQLNCTSDIIDKQTTVLNVYMAADINATVVVFIRTVIIIYSSFFVLLLLYRTMTDKVLQTVILFVQMQSSSNES
jgi:hypothetical protein